MVEEATQAFGPLPDVHGNGRLAVAMAERPSSVHDPGAHSHGELEPASTGASGAAMQPGRPVVMRFRRRPKPTGLVVLLGAAIGLFLVTWWPVLDGHRVLLGGDI